MSVRSLVRLAVGAVLLAGSAAPVLAQAACPGRDMLAEMRAADPQGFAEMRRVADATKNATSRFWKIENPSAPDRQPSYLFGTIHLTDDRVIAMPDAVIEAIGTARRVALEVEDLSAGRVAEALSGMTKAAFLPVGQSLHDKLSAAERTRADVILAKAGLPPAQVKRVRPWVALALTTSTDCEKSRKLAGKLTLDASIAERAERFGIGTLGLETVESQFEAMANVSDQDQLALLRANLATHERIDDVTETFVQLYLKRDFGMMLPFQIALARRAGIEPGAFDSFRENLLTVRNKHMRDRAAMHLQRGGLFIAVGALHLVGETGMVELFREIGFKVTPAE
jgi:hypothetical protein